MTTLPHDLPPGPRFRRRRVRLLCLAFLAAVACGEMSWGEIAAAGEQPNILLIVADDLGFSDLGCYGGEIETPNLDRLAAEGLRLSQFAATPRCCPSRGCLLTGRVPHSVGLGHMTKDLGQPGYRGRLRPGTPTAATLLGEAGYRSFLSGKWHLGTSDPTRHGFEEFYGTLVSAKTFWDADHFSRLPVGREARGSSEDGFYATDAVADHAIDFLERAAMTPKRPWFLYVAFNAPHFPLHAPPKAIAKYADRYGSGWDVVRERRLARQKALGVVPASVSLSPRSEYYGWGRAEPQPIPAWESLPADRQADLGRRMAIYAAMVDRMDAAIGDLLDVLESRGERESTLIVFTSDNGACAEWDAFGFDGKSGPNNVLHTGASLAAMGGKGTFHSVGAGWANVSNTPWRLFKHFPTEGGTAAPFLVAGPGLQNPGRIDDTPTHLEDVLPTMLEVAGSNPGPDLPGRSLVPLLEGRTLRPRPLFFEHEGHRAIREGRWKLLALRGQPWQLFDLEGDRTETTDLAAKHPERVRSLAAAWDRWAAANSVTPLPEDLEVAYLPSAEGGDSAQSTSTAGAVTPPQVVGPIRRLADGFRFTEGPVWDGHETLYFSDLPNHTLHRWTERDGVETLRTGEAFSNGLGLDAAGRLVFCEVGSRRIVRRAVDGTEETLADSVAGRPLGPPDDLWIAPDGAVYFTVPQKTVRGQPSDAVMGTVLRIDPNDGTVRDLDAADTLLQSPNGIVGSSDGTVLCVADPKARCCWRFTLLADGGIAGRTKAAAIGSDGLTLDEHGNLYTTGRGRIGIWSPEGTQLQEIELPEKPSNLTFGGPDSRTLLVTARTGVYAIPMSVRGDGADRRRPHPRHQPDAEPTSGSSDLAR